MNPPTSRQRSQSVSRHSQQSQQSEPVTFKTQGQTYNMSKLVENTFLKPEVLESVIPNVVNSIKPDFIAELMSIVKTAVVEAVNQAVREAVKPFNELVKSQDEKMQVYDVIDLVQMAL